MASFEHEVIHGLYDDLLLSDLGIGNEMAGYMEGAYGVSAIAVRDLGIGQAMLVQSCNGAVPNAPSDLYVVDVFRDKVCLVRPLDAGIGALSRHWPFIKAGGGSANFGDAFYVAEQRGWQSVENGDIAGRLAEAILIGRSPRLF